MADDFTPMQTGFIRVFLIENGARADRAHEYHNCMRPGAIEQALGDVTKIECPDPNRFGQYIEVGRIQGATERPTTQIVGRYPADEESTLARIAKKRCDSDYQFNIGVCEDASVFSQFQKKIIFEDGPVTNYATDELGTLSSDGSAEVNETADLSGKVWYEVLGIDFAERGGDVVTNELVDVVICDQANCGDCDDPSDGCEKIFALSTAAGGSPSTPPDVVYSLDKGATWQAVDIDTMATAEVPNALACVGDYVVVVSNETNSAHIALKSEFTTTPAVTWTEVTTGFVVGGEPNDIWSVGNDAWIVGDGGYVYKMTDPTAGVTVVDAGVAVTDNLQAVHATSNLKMVAVGNAGSIVKSDNGTTVAEVTPSPVGVGVNFTSVWTKSNDSNQWFIGGNDGNLWYTINGGTGFTASSFSGSGAGVVRDIAFSTKSIGYLSHDTATPAGRIFRTYNGGANWHLMPEGSGTIPANDRLTALAACEDDPNFVVGVGLGDNGTDGIILGGED